MQKKRYKGQTTNPNKKIKPKLKIKKEKEEL